MYVNFKTTLPALLLAGCFAPLSATHAAIINVTFTVSNLSGSNGTAISPVFLAFHDGSYDPFNSGASASSAIKSIAEAGDGSGLAASLPLADPNGISRTVTASSNAFGPGIFLPGASGSITVQLDSVKNRYLSYFAMVVPSNDRFVGNDSSTELSLFDSQGHFTGGKFQVQSNRIWDAGTEQDGSTGAAFLVGSNGADNPLQNALIQANPDFSVYNGLPTPAGYNFTNLPGANTPLLEINAVTAVPVPAALWLFSSALPLMGLFRKRITAVSI